MLDASYRVDAGAGMEGSSLLCGELRYRSVEVGERLRGDAEAAAGCGF